MKVAAIFVQSRGCYVGLPDVDPWDIKRDARRYDGPHPVVAHPPCHVWCRLAGLAYAVHGGEHLRPGNDGGCFESALASVRRWGGVLEHPAWTRAFDAFALPRPLYRGWNATIDGGWVCSVWQSAYGHRAQKDTWLYYWGERAPFDLNWTRVPGTHQVGRCAIAENGRKLDSRKTPLSKREASATPPAFRDVLIELARHAVGDVRRSA